MRVLICGGRNEPVQPIVEWLTNNLEQCLKDKFGTVFFNPVVDVVIHGGAKGADTAAGIWAEANYIPLEVYRANWDLFGKAAGHIRNARMLKTGMPDVIVAFPGGSGTANMIKQASKAKIPVIKVSAI